MFKLVFTYLLWRRRSKPWRQNKSIEIIKLDEFYGFSSYRGQKCFSIMSDFHLQAMAVKTVILDILYPFDCPFCENKKCILNTVKTMFLQHTKLS